MEIKELKMFWITRKKEKHDWPDYSHDPIGFGVTAFDKEEAFKIIEGFDYKIPETYQVEELANLSSLPQWVRETKGSHIFRGMWYPFVCLGVPEWMEL